MGKKSSSFIQSLRAAAKQADDEESLMRKNFIVKSMIMSPNGDCAYELMCIWRTIHQIRRFGRQIPTAVIDGSIPSQQIVAMRNAIADEQEKQISNGNTALQTLIVQSLVDWSRSPMENNGRNAEVQVALQSLPPGATENEWFYSPDELDLHSALLRTGQSEVFAESGEMEAFSLMLQVPLAIYLPGYTELYPQSVPLGSDNEDYLVGICHGNNYFLAVPRRWIQNQQGKHKGMLRMLSK